MSKRSEKQTLIENTILILLFVLGANFFIFLKMTGIEDSAIAIDSRISGPPSILHLRISIGGAIIGMLILWYESYIHPKVTKRFTSLLLRRLVWQIDVAFIILVPIFLLNVFFGVMENKLPLKLVIGESLGFMTTGLFFSFFIYFYFLSILVSFLRRLHKSFGQHVFYNYLIGRYTEPLEENRTFLFLDLNDSTRIAEELGHIKYSRFLNRCFDDIINAVREYEYDIYQFVGDEVVFTWPASQNDKGQAVHMYLAIKNQFRFFDNLYRTKFGTRPYFKAAVSTGKVTATLVGGKTKNIAYHGDVLNTTARLLGLCKKYGRDLLFTQFYLKSLTRPFFEHELIATLKLRGKANESKIYAMKH
ncbi:adenylate/guanylate cyclase domain-containing protein [Ulvibacterium sp.]|uniref:adenylate/guanylate cyclase domain-containing protein n=1 Tax=Ulvibacterium sp. TaxID=2665914 RepID=UPI0026291C34|nr:adenylate/guanylate cyclase domain-containing protein [Ulvibacterium sp.]